MTFIRFFFTLFFISIIVCGSSFPSLSKVDNKVDYSEGTWRYAVKVKDTTKFNEKAFLARLRGEELKQKPKVKNYIGKREIHLNDVIYTGYFHLSKKPGESKEYTGNYNPESFAIASEFIPISFVDAKENKELKQKEYIWVSDFRNKTASPSDAVWVTKAVRKNEDTHKMTGYIAALSCPNKSNGNRDCSMINFVQWNAVRIPDINYYTKKNHKWQPLMAKILRFFDKSGNLEKFVFGKFFKEERKPFFYHKDASESIFLKENYMAALPVKACTDQSDQSLQSICDPSYCATKAANWPPKPPGQSNAPDIVPQGSTQQEKDYNDLVNRQAYCDSVMEGRRSLCCNSMSAGGGEKVSSDGEPECVCTTPNGAVSAARCCTVTASCEETKKTTDANGNVQVSTTTQTYDHNNMSNAQACSIAGMDPVFGQYLGVPPNSPSGMTQSIDQSIIGTNERMPSCAGGMPCGGSVDSVLPDV